MIHIVTASRTAALGQGQLLLSLAAFGKLELLVVQRVQHFNKQAQA